MDGEVHRKLEPGHALPDMQRSSAAVSEVVWSSRVIPLILGLPQREQAFSQRLWRLGNKVEQCGYAILVDGISRSRKARKPLAHQDSPPPLFTVVGHLPTGSTTTGMFDA